VGLSSNAAKQAFDALVQRDAPDANRGRAFARFETRFQLAWVVAGVIPVLIVIPGWAGFLIVAIVMGLTLLNYVAGNRASAFKLRVKRAVPRRRASG
jgi:hypothetical protein